MKIVGYVLSGLAGYMAGEFGLKGLVIVLIAEGAMARSILGK